MLAGGSQEFEVTALLCDAAQVAAGKLFVLGGGWDRILVPNVPTATAVALIITVPWHRANERHQLRATLLTQDGGEVRQQPGGPPVRFEGLFEVGRPPGTPQGAALLVPIAISVPHTAFQPGGYRWEIAVDGNVLRTLAFHVNQPQAG